MPDQDEPTSSTEAKTYDVHDMGGAIGAADDSNAAAGTSDARVAAESGSADAPTGEGHVTATDIANAMAVDALPDQLRTGQWNQDETDSVVDTTGQLRELDEHQ